VVLLSCFTTFILVIYNIKFVKVVRLKEYRVPIAEFKEKLGITEKIENISYWGGTCKEEKQDEVTIEVAE